MVNQVIMVISPDRNQAGVMVACLQDAGYRAAAAEISEGAMDDHCRQNPDLLLLEWQLPDLAR